MNFKIIETHGDYVGECAFQHCTHNTKSIYNRRHKYTHFNNQLVHDNCYRALNRQRHKQQEQQTIHTLQQHAHDIQQQHPPIILPPPPRHAIIPAIIIAMEDNTLPSPPLTPPSHPTQEQQRLLEGSVHFSIAHITQNLYIIGVISIHISITNLYMITAIER